MKALACCVAASIGLTVASCGRTERPSLRALAASYRSHLRHGQWMGELKVPRFHATVPVYNGFDQVTIDEQGPGWFSRSYLPGEQGVTYIAGHRLTHGGPFKWLGRLRAGDELVMSLPYATATYAVTQSRLIEQTDVAVLQGPRRDELRLQTSTIPGGRRRLVVFARMLRIRRTDP